MIRRFVSLVLLVGLLLALASCALGCAPCDTTLCVPPHTEVHSTSCEAKTDCNMSGGAQYMEGTGPIVVYLKNLNTEKCELEDMRMDAEAVCHAMVPGYGKRARWPNVSVTVTLQALYEHEFPDGSKGYKDWSVASYVIRCGIVIYEDCVC